MPHPPFVPPRGSTRVALRGACIRQRQPPSPHRLSRAAAPHPLSRARLAEPIAHNEELLYRRGNFNGSWDQLIVAALTAITYPNTAVAEMTGVEIKEHLEKLCDKIFNPDPYQHQGGDMIRTGGLAYACEPGAPKGSRVRDMVVNGRAVEPARSYKVAHWGVGSSPGGSSPIWEVIEAYLRGGSSARVHTPNVPRLIGVAANPGYDPRME